MYNFFELEERLNILVKAYIDLCGKENVTYRKDICATLEEILVAEKKLNISVPTSLRETFLNFSKSIYFEAYLPEDLNLPQEVQNIYLAKFEFSLDNYVLADENFSGREMREEEEIPHYEGDWYFGSLLHNKLAFAEIPNGDMLTFDLNDEKEDKRVMYLSHDGDDMGGYILGNNFLDYLNKLILIGGCDVEDLGLFLDDEDEGIHVDCKNAILYREAIGLAW